MRLSRAPALPPAAALVLGAALAFALPRPGLAAPALLVAAGVALGRRGGVVVACLGLGLLNAAAREALPARRAPSPSSRRPVAAVARLAGDWRPGPFGWSAPVVVEHLSQGGTAWRPPRRVWLEIPRPEAPPPVAARLRLKGYLKRSPGFANPPPVEAGPWRLKVKSRRLLEVDGEVGVVPRHLRAARRRVGEALALAGERPGAALARALVLGDRDALPAGWRRGLRRGGMAHLLAVSGLHVGLVAALALLAAARLGRRPRLLLALAAVAGYLLLVGPRPSLLRASCMALLAVAALLLERPPAAANALAVFTGLAVLVAPALVVDLGFQLTVAATAGMVLWAPALARRWSSRGGGRTLPSGWMRALAAALAPQLASLPWALPAFHLVHPAAPLLNLLLVPWTALALALSLAWTALALVAPGAALALAPLLDLAAWPFAALATTAPRPWLGVPAVLSGGGAALLALALAAAAWWPRRAGVALTCALLAGTCGAEGREGGAAEVSVAMLDVGQGDALLLRDGRRALLVDGGGWIGGDLGGRVLVPALAAQGVGRLDAVALTHPDRDHCRGLVDLVGYLPVAEVWTAPGWGGEPCADELAAAPGPRLRLLWRGEVARLGRWRFTALHPPPGEAGGGNDRSLVLAAEALGRRLLLTGDIEAAVERRLMRHFGAGLRADVLKVAHHGSKTSTTPAFLAAVAPRLALISAGPDNPYGHPAPPVLERLAERHILTLRTDRHGMVVLRWGAGGPVHIALPAAPRIVVE